MQYVSEVTSVIPDLFKMKLLAMIFVLNIRIVILPFQRAQYQILKALSKLQRDRTSPQFQKVACCSS
jgi:hypothetical protein